MLHSTKALVMLSTLVIISCATAPSGKTFDSAIGVWSDKYTTSMGKTRSSVVTITDETRGAYTNPDGRIEFYSIDDQRAWKGYWIEESGTKPCPTEKSGSMYWGEQIYQFNETYNQYTGTWDFCGKGEKYSFKGVR
jgi:hypothetical protein